MRQRDFQTAGRTLGLVWLGESLRLRWQDRPGGNFDARRFDATPEQMLALADALDGAADAPDHASVDLGGDGDTTEFLLVRDPIYTDIRLNADGKWLSAMPLRVAHEMAEVLRQWAREARIASMDLAHVTDHGSLADSLSRSR